VLRMLPSNTHPRRRGKCVAMPDYWHRVGRAEIIDGGRDNRRLRPAKAVNTHPNNQQALAHC